MASDIRAILECVPAARLRDLCEKRGLTTGGDQHDKRTRLARSLRGNLDWLVPELHKKEMADALGQYTYTGDHGLEGQLYGLGRASRDHLVAMMELVFGEEGYDPSQDGESPVGPDSPIRFWATGSDEEEDEEDEEAGDEDEDEDGPDDDLAYVEDDADDGNKYLEEPEDADGRRSLETDFHVWITRHMGGKERTNLLVKTLVNRLGRFRADQRLTLRAVSDLARVLANFAYVTEPDLGAMTRSPGIGQRVTVRARGGVSGPEVRSPPPDWQPVPPHPRPQPTGNGHAQPFRPDPMPPPVKPFELAAIKLQFLTLVSAAVRPPDEGTRRYAVDLASRGLTLGAADQVRLRALAHQYASGHGDLNAVVTALRTGLPAEQRRGLLDDVRALTPTTAELEELLTVYATDLGVSASPPPPPPPGVPPAPDAAAATWPDEEVTEQSAKPPVDAPVEAGGVRTNPALDALFGPE